jgi:hypothetical protein
VDGDGAGGWADVGRGSACLNVRNSLILIAISPSRSVANSSVVVRFEVAAAETVYAGAPVDAAEIIDAIGYGQILVHIAFAIVVTSQH